MSDDLELRVAMAIHKADALRKRQWVAELAFVRERYVAMARAALEESRRYVPATFDDALGAHERQWGLHMPWEPAQFVRFGAYDVVHVEDWGRLAVDSVDAPPPPKATARVTPEPDMAAREKWSGDTDA